jgi:hypothetical protein
MAEPTGPEAPQSAPTPPAGTDSPFAGTPTPPAGTATPVAGAQTPPPQGPPPPPRKPRKSFLETLGVLGLLLWGLASIAALGGIVFFLVQFMKKYEVM